MLPCLVESLRLASFSDQEEFSGGWILDGAEKLLSGLSSLTFGRRLAAVVSCGAADDDGHSLDQRSMHRL